jgi:hypothetical protein
MQPTYSDFTKPQMLERIQQERLEWEQLLETVGEENMREPGAMGDWTFKDFVAHMTGWWQHALLPLRRAIGDANPTPPWPQELKDVDAINDWIYRQNKDRSPEDVLEDARIVWRDFEEYMQQLSARELTEAGHFDWMDESPLGPAVMDSFLAHWHDEHESEVRQRVDRLQAR